MLFHTSYRSAEQTGSVLADWPPVLGGGELDTGRRRAGGQTSVVTHTHIYICRHTHTLSNRHICRDEYAEKDRNKTAATQTGVMYK